jgi:hypothetical protein
MSRLGLDVNEFHLDLTTPPNRPVIDPAQLAVLDALRDNGIHLGRAGLNGAERL